VYRLGPSSNVKAMHFCFAQLYGPLGCGGIGFGGFGFGAVAGVAAGPGVAVGGWASGDSPGTDKGVLSPGGGTSAGSGGDVVTGPVNVGVAAGNAGDAVASAVPTGISAAGFVTAQPLRITAPTIAVAHQIRGRPTCRV